MPIQPIVSEGVYSMSPNWTPQQLREFIDSDPEAASLLQAEDDEGCAARVNSLLPPVKVKVAADAVLELAAKSGTLGKIELTAEAGSGAPAEIRGCCKTFLRLVADKGWSLDLEDPAIRQMAEGLVLAGLLTQAQLDNLDAMATVSQTVTVTDVKNARGL